MKHNQVCGLNVQIKTSLLPKRTTEVPGAELSFRASEREVLSYAARCVLLPKAVPPRLGGFLWRLQPGQ